MQMATARQQRFSRGKEGTGSWVFLKTGCWQSGHLWRPMNTSATSLSGCGWRASERERERAT